MTRRPMSATTLVLACSLWMATAGNLALWNRMADLGLLRDVRGWAFAASLAAMISALLATLLSFVAWRRTLKPAATVLLVATALASHFMSSYHVVIDPGMMVNVLQTDLHEATALVDLRFFASLFFLAALPAAWLWRQPVDWGSARRQWGRNALLAVLPVFVFAGLLLASFHTLAPVMRSHTDLRYLINPLNSVYALGRLAAGPLKHPRLPMATAGEDAHLRASRPADPARPPLVVLVIGETARSGNFSLNGYDRPTNPELAREATVSFTQVASCGTSTAISLPCMFSPLGRERWNARDRDSEGLLDILQRAGLAVLWLDNQSGCKGVCDRVPHADTCPAGDCLDEVMLQGLDERLRALDPARRARGTVVVMHQMGSHGPAYHLRSPASRKPFLPECTTASLQDCPREQVVNAYDNSIAYTDHFLARTIAWLRQHDGDARTAMVYVADHGESLGEGGIYLHGMPYGIAPEVQKVVPWITWLSPAWEQVTGMTLQCVRQTAGEPVSHDHYLHSVLGLLAVETAVYRQGMDAYGRCHREDVMREPHPALVAATRLSS